MVKIFTVWILSICLLIMQVDILKKKMETNTWFLNYSVNENKGFLKKYADIWGGIKSEIKP